MNVCGIDVGGSKIELAVYAHDGTVSHLRRIATPCDDYQAFLHAIRDLIAEAENAVGALDGIGVGLPGIAERETGARISSNVAAINGRAVASDLRNLLQRDIAIGNDCQLFALSEANGGSGAGVHSVYGAIVGTGVGAGLCIDGKLIASFNTIAGEWGHLALPARLQQQYALPLFQCGCGLRGCLERYASGSAIGALYSHFTGIPLETPEIVRRMREGEQAASDVFAMVVDALGYGLASVVLVVDPHVIVLGGGLSQLNELYERLPAAVQRHLFASVRVPPILPPTFGDAGGTRGAALLARADHFR
jgi:N-acetylglucosamine kinase